MRGHWRRFSAQLAALAVMLLVNAVSTSFYVTVVAALLVILPTASWTVFGLLSWTERQAPDIQSLRERVDDALTGALASSAAAAIGAAVLGRQFGLFSDPLGSLITVGLGYILIETSVPAIGFLRTWRDVYLPMVRGRRDGKVLAVFEHQTEARMDAMEGRLQTSIDANTVLTQTASDHAEEAYREANSVNTKIADLQAQNLASKSSEPTD